jgi:hypothetical protein
VQQLTKPVQQLTKPMLYVCVLVCVCACVCVRVCTGAYIPLSEHNHCLEAELVKGKIEDSEIFTHKSKGQVDYFTVSSLKYVKQKKMDIFLSQLLFLLLRKMRSPEQKPILVRKRPKCVGTS